MQVTINDDDLGTSPFQQPPSSKTPPKTPITTAARAIMPAPPPAYLPLHWRVSAQSASLPIHPILFRSPFPSPPPRPITTT